MSRIALPPTEHRADAWSRLTTLLASEPPEASLVGSGRQAADRLPSTGSEHAGNPTEDS